MLHSFGAFFSTKSNDSSNTFVASVTLDGLISTAYVTDTCPRAPSLSPSKANQNKCYRSQIHFDLVDDRGRQDSLSCGKVRIDSWICGEDGDTCWISAALHRDMKDLKEVTSFKSCDTDFKYSRGIRQERVEAPTLWMKLTRFFFGTLMKYGILKAWRKYGILGEREISSVRKETGRTSFCSISWRDNFWIMRERHTDLDRMVKELTLTWRRSPNHLWWFSACAVEDTPMVIEEAGNFWVLSRSEEYDVSESRYMSNVKYETRNGKNTKKIRMPDPKKRTPIAARRFPDTEVCQSGGSRIQRDFGLRHELVVVARDDQ